MPFYHEDMGDWLERAEHVKTVQERNEIVFCRGCSEMNQCIEWNNYCIEAEKEFDALMKRKGLSYDIE
jgi:16S rRNA G527 N7-methylase RsmG